MDTCMLRGTFGVDIKRLGSQSVGGAQQTLVALDFGAAFSPLDNLKVGISNYRLGSTPPAGVNRVPAGDTWFTGVGAIVCTRPPPARRR